MANKSNKGMALGLVLIIMIIFLMLATAMLGAASANVRQMQVVHAVNTHFWEAESYLHERIHDIHEYMQNDISSEFQTRVANLIPTPLYIAFVPSPHENMGSYLAHRINQGMDSSNFRAYMEGRINTAFLAARDNDSLRTGSLAFEGISEDLEISSIDLNLPVNPAMVSGSGSVNVSFSPKFTITSHSAGVATSVDVVLALGFSFSYQEQSFSRLDIW